MRLVGSFERQATFIFIAGTLSNIGAYLFHVYMGRHLSPADYGILYTLLALLMMVSVPAGTIQTVITKYVSHFKAHNQYGKVRFLFFYQLSIHRFRFLYVACVFTLLQIIAISLFHKTLSQVVWILVANGALLFLINQFLVWIPKRRLERIKVERV